jgi:hypothetical protein
MCRPRPAARTAVAVPCGIATDNGEYPNLFDTHNVWNNANSDGSFGVTSPIFLDYLTTDGWPARNSPHPHRSDGDQLQFEVGAGPEPLH